MPDERNDRVTITDDASTSPFIGVLLLDSEAYERDEYLSDQMDNGLGGRPPGFFGNPRTWSAPVIYRVARGCDGEESAKASRRASAAMADAAHALDGRVDIITTNCAYTWYFRHAFKDVRTPVMPSGNALLSVARDAGPRTVLLVSHSPTVLAHASPLPPDVRLVELEHEHEWHRFHFGLETSSEPLRIRRMAHELRHRIRSDIDRNGRPSAVVLECTGLPQFRDIVRSEYHAPVFDIVSTVHTALGLTAPQTYPEVETRDDMALADRRAS